MKETKAQRTLTVAQWTQLVQNGASLCISTCLDGTSMQPLIRKEKDIVTVAPVHRPLKCGDIVLLQRADGVYVMHRIRRLYESTIITLGDNCWKEDMPLPRTAVLGIAVHMQRGKHTIALDSALSRAAGRLWMACHRGRIFYRRVRNAAICRIKRVLTWKKAEL